MTKIIRVGIIGQGRSGYDIHADAIKKLPEKYKIVAIADQEEKYRNRAKDEFNCVAYEDYSDLLNHDDLDLIINASPSHLHTSLSEQFLQHGFDVLCEKPLARRAVEVDRLIEVCEETKSRLFVFQQSRFAAAFQHIMEVIRSGRIGRVVQPRVAANGFQRRWDWQTLQANNGGNLLNTGPHPLDQCLQILGTDTMPTVFCRMDRVHTFGDAEDYVKIILSEPGKPLIDLEISSSDALPLAQYHIQGEYGTISGDINQLKLRVYDPQTAPEQKLIRTPLMNANGTPGYCNEKLDWTEEVWNPIDNQNIGFDFMNKTYYTKLHDAIVNETAMEITPEQIRMQIAIIEECHRQNPLEPFAD